MSVVAADTEPATCCSVTVVHDDDGGGCQLTTFVVATHDADVAAMSDRAVGLAGRHGVNVHTFPDAPYAPFDVRNIHGTWSATVHPEYYGLLMFTEAAPPPGASSPLSDPPSTSLP